MEGDFGVIVCCYWGETFVFTCGILYYSQLYYEEIEKTILVIQFNCFFNFYSMCFIIVVVVVIIIIITIITY
jgi:hypothetical protein